MFLYNLTQIQPIGVHFVAFRMDWDNILIR